MIESEPKRKISKRGRQGEGRPSKRTPEVVAKIAEAIAIGLTDEQASLLTRSAALQSRCPGVTPFARSHHLLGASS
jgi:hypothetical protein